MNYRHAYHAGNHADVLKHIVLTRVLVHLRKKDKPFRVIDAHAGIGTYDLNGIEAGKTGEWQGGIGRLAEPFTAEIEALLAPYRACIAALNPGGGLTRYPGSPAIAAQLLRGTDHMVANELHPADVQLLDDYFHHDPRISVSGLDAETSIKAHLPPPDRRGVVLIDPPYEAKDEAERALRMLGHGIRRFSTGVFMLWYPLKADQIDTQVCKEAAALGVPGTLRIELRIREAFKSGGLAGSGLIVINPPWTLVDELRLIVPALAARLGLGNWGHGTVEWLVPPK